MPRPTQPILWIFLLLCLYATARTEWFGMSVQDAGGLNRELLWAGEYWRAPVTIFMHGGWWHLLLNGLALYVLGRAVVLGCGSWVFAIFTLAAALGGLALSILVPSEEDLFRVGISGGVLGLLGLILAIEWSAADGWRSFLKRRNVKVIGFFLALNVALAVGVEKLFPAVSLDHAAHLGGLAIGLLGGLAWYTRRGPRPARGLAVCLVLMLVPSLYAAYPYWNADFFRYRGERAFAADRTEQAEKCFERVLELDEGDPVAAARLAWLRDDPSPLQNLAPRDHRSRELLVATHLQLARSRLETEPATALMLAKAARKLALDAPKRPRRWQRWFAHGAQAATENQPILAEFLFDTAYEFLMPAERKGVLWWPLAQQILPKAQQMLAVPDLTEEERMNRALEVVDLALAASAGVARGSDDTDELRLLAIAAKVEIWARTLEGREPPPRDLPTLLDRLVGFHFRMAENSRAESRIPAYRLQAARIAERRLALLDEPSEIERERERVEGLYRAAYSQARELEHPVIAAQAGHWLRERGIEPPEPEPEGEDEGSETTPGSGDLADPERGG